MFAKDNKGSGYRATIVAGFLVLALSTAAAGAYVAFADQSNAPPAVSLVSAAQAPADLEGAFWVCDYVATNYGVHATPVASCMEATAALQERKFGGDFAQLLEWWGRNKATEHAKVQAAQLAGNTIR
jgi:hypothetical protein